MECKLARYLVLDTFTATHIGIYEAGINDQAILQCLQDPAVQPLLRSLAKMALQRRIQEQKYPVRSGDDLQAAREIRRLQEEFESRPISMLAGVLAAQDVESLCRLYRPHIQMVIARRMAVGEETIRDGVAGTDTFVSDDICIGSYRFKARCVRQDGDRILDAELIIDLMPPAGDPPAQAEGQTEKGNGRVHKTA
jgi:hypothetical protein